MVGRLVREAKNDIYRILRLLKGSLVAGRAVKKRISFLDSLFSMLSQSMARSPERDNVQLAGSHTLVQSTRQSVLEIRGGIETLL